MASIGLYDCEFWHSETKLPNLELMKTFNYYYSRGDIVTFLSPQDSFIPFNKVLFFKEYVSTRIPKSIGLSGENIERYGYGFYKTFEPLKEGENCPPDYLPYEMRKDKVKRFSVFNKIKRGSLIRLENEDFSDLKPNGGDLYLIDHDANRLANFKSFVLDYKEKYNIHFLKGIEIFSEKELEDFFSIYAASGNKIQVSFDFSKDFFLKYYIDNFLIYPCPSEKNFEKDLYKTICLILYAKSDNKILNFKKITINSIKTDKCPLLKLYPSILEWNWKGKEDFFSYIKQNKGLLKVFNEVLCNKPLLRTALKQKPTKMLVQRLDF